MLSDSMNFILPTYLLFLFYFAGRNFQDQDEKIRAKRSTPPENLPVAKSPERIHRGIYMRLGRSPSFMRYGRDPDQALDFPDPSSLVGKNRGNFFYI